MVGGLLSLFHHPDIGWRLCSRVFGVHQRRLIFCWTCVQSAVPAMPLETLFAGLRYCCVGPLETPTQNCAADTLRPVRLHTSIAHSSYIVSVADHVVAFTVTQMVCEGRNVRPECIWVVGYVDDQRRWAGDVLGIAPKEGRTVQ